LRHTGYMANWKCIKNCGACCQLNPDERPDLEEYLTPAQLSQYLSMVVGVYTLIAKPVSVPFMTRDRNFVVFNRIFLPKCIKSNRENLSNLRSIAVINTLRIFMGKIA